MPFKDDIGHLADLKQQIWQKMILPVQHIALMSLCCEFPSLDRVCIPCSAVKIELLAYTHHTASRSQRTHPILIHQFQKTSCKCRDSINDWKIVANA